MQKEEQKEEQKEKMNSFISILPIVKDYMIEPQSEYTTEEIEMFYEFWENDSIYFEYLVAACYDLLKLPEVVDVIFNKYDTIKIILINNIENNLVPFDIMNIIIKEKLEPAETTIVLPNIIQLKWRA